MKAGEVDEILCRNRLQFEFGIEEIPCEMVLIDKIAVKNNDQEPEPYERGAHIYGMVRETNREQHEISCFLVGHDGDHWQRLTLEGALEVVSALRQMYGYADNGYFSRILLNK